MTDAQYERIIAYLRGQLPQEEVLDFERQLAIDPILKQQVTSLRSGLDILHIDRRQQLLQELEAAQLASFPQQIATPKWQNPYLLIGLAASLLIAFGVLFRSSLFGPDLTTLADAYLQPYPVPGTLMGAPSGQSLTNPYYSYHNRAFATAIRRFREEEQQTGLSDDAAFYLANALLQVDSIAPAKALLLPYTRSENPWQAASQWYLALSYLRTRDLDSATYYLELLAHTSTDKFGQDAQALLAQLPTIP